MTKDSLIPVRVNNELKIKLEQEAEKTGISLSSLTNNILEGYISTILPFNEMRWIYISKSVFSILLDPYSDKQIVNIAKLNAAPEHETLIELTYGVFEWHNTIYFLQELLKAFHFPYRSKQESGSSEFSIVHDMGKKWALFFFSTFESLVNKLGGKMSETVIKGSTLSFKIERGVTPN